MEEQMMQMGFDTSLEQTRYILNSRLPSNNFMSIFDIRQGNCKELGGPRQDWQTVTNFDRGQGIKFPIST